jgi:hypothetical protein
MVLVINLSSASSFLSGFVMTGSGQSRPSS